MKEEKCSLLLRRSLNKGATVVKYIDERKRGIDMFHLFKKSSPAPSINRYDPSTQKPILRCSICTGEQVAGFKDLHTGKFTDIMLIRDDRDLQTFKEQYGVTDITKEF